jgi:predicted GNAT family acetyltransferase
MVSPAKVPGTMAVVSNEVRHNPDRSRYELLIDGELVGIADYHVQGGVIVIPHTEIDRAKRGNGLGAELVKGTLDDIRRSGRAVVPQCWYVAEFIDEHPAYQDLLRTA